MEKWYFESLTIHYSRIFNLIISKCIYFLFHPRFGLCSFIIKVCCFIISLQSSELNFWRFCIYVTIFENVNKIYGDNRGELINLVQQKLSTLLGQLATAYICDWLTKVKRIYEPGMRKYVPSVLMVSPVYNLHWFRVKKSIPKNPASIRAV